MLKTLQSQQRRSPIHALERALRDAAEDHNAGGNRADPFYSPPEGMERSLKALFDRLQFPANSLAMLADSPAFSLFTQTIARAVAPLVVADAVMADIAQASCIKALSKGEHLLRAGDVAEHLFLVESGLLRYYFIDQRTGDVRTGQFFDEGSIFTDASSFISGTPATQSVESLEDCTVLLVPRSALHAGFATDHALKRFGRLVVEEALIGSQRRTTNLLRLGPEELYRTFVTTRPEVARRVPQYLIAGYLGITPEALSRIRGRLAKRPPPQA